MKTFFLPLASFFLAAAAFASGHANPGAQDLSFDQLRVACQNPSRFHNQTAPTNIQVSCRDIQYKWVPDTDGNVTLDTSRQITSSVFSDKYTVNPVVANMQVSPQVIACPRYKEVAEGIETVRAVDCAALIAFSGNAADFCSETVNALRAGNPQAVTQTATGKVIALCGRNYRGGEGSSSSH